MRGRSFELPKGDAMNREWIEGSWMQMKGKAREQWGRLIGDELAVMAGKRDQRNGRGQEEYGIMKDASERQLREFAARYGTRGPACRASRDPNRGPD